MKVDEAIKSAIDRAGVIRVRNAMHRLLRLSPASANICLYAAYLFRDDAVLRCGLALLGSLPVLAWVAAYFIVTLRDPVICVASRSDGYSLSRQVRAKLPKQRLIITEVEVGKMAGWLPKSIWLFLRGPEPVGADTNA